MGGRFFDFLLRHSHIILLCFILTACSANDELKISALDHFKRGNNHYKQNDLLAAESEYKKAISSDPDQERFYYNLGLVYYSLVLYEKAVDQYNKSIELNPKFAEAWYNLALALEKLDETEKAFQAYQKYKKLRELDQKKVSEPEKPVVTSK